MESHDPANRILEANCGRLGADGFVNRNVGTIRATKAVQLEKSWPEDKEEFELWRVSSLRLDGTSTLQSGL